MIILLHIFTGKAELPSDDGKKQIDLALVHCLMNESSTRRMFNHISTNALPDMNVNGFRSTHDSLRCLKKTTYVSNQTLNQSQNALSLPITIKK